MTKAQVKKTMTIMKNQCISKTGVAEGTSLSINFFYYVLLNSIDIF